MRIARLTCCRALRLLGTSNVRVCRQSARPRQREALRFRVARCRAGGAGSRVLPLWKLQPLLLGPEDSRAARPSSALSTAALRERAWRARCGGSLPGPGRAQPPYFARDISALPDPLAAALAGLGHFRDARAGGVPAAARSDGDHGPGQGSASTGTRATASAASAGRPRSASEGGYRRHLPGVQGRAFSAHRSGGHHAGDGREPLSPRAQQALCRRALLDARGLHRAGRDDRRGGAARSPRRGGRARQPACVISRPSPGRSRST